MSGILVGPVKNGKTITANKIGVIEGAKFALRFATACGIGAQVVA